ncbi:MAG: non-homologous end-joining DNA ligase [Actinomycetota bacterium]
MRGKRIPTTKVAGWMEPMLATLVESLPDSRGWVFERKLDGIRALAYREGGAVRLYSRNKLPLEDSFPSVVDALGRLAGPDVVLDGEVVAIRDGKVGGFEALQQRTSRTALRYYIFDVLSLDGNDVRPLPLLERRRLLGGLRLTGALRRTATRTGDAEKLRSEACAAGWEGVIAKRADSPYRAGRSKDWLKLKCVLEQEFVVGGYTEPKGGRQGFGALMIGYHEDGKLRHGGEVGTGFNERTLADLSARLAKLESNRSPFADHPKARKGERFVKPKLVVQVGFSEWTRDGKLRHPRFLGVRTDKKPGDVVRERPS